MENTNTISIGFTAKTTAELAEQMRTMANTLQPLSSPAPKSKSQAKRLAVQTEAAAAEETDEDTEYDLGDEEETETEEATITQDDVVKGFQAFAKKHSREEAGKILKGFKVKSVADLKESQYADVMKKLGK